MKRERKTPDEPQAHLDSRGILDYLDGSLAPAARRAAEEHLAGSCAGCRERLRSFGQLRSVMRGDRTPSVPLPLRERALSVFGPAIDVTPAPSLAWRLARVMFDSLLSPAPLAVRRAVGDARRVRFSLAELTLEVEFEQAEAGVVTIRGQLGGPEATLHRVALQVAGETYEAWPDATGAFSIPQVPPGTLVMRVEGPAGSFETPPVDV